jgi:hypothetical protein
MLRVAFTIAKLLVDIAKQVIEAVQEQGLLNLKTLYLSERVASSFFFYDHDSINSR